MNRKGKISNISLNSVRVIFEDINTVSYELKIAKHISLINLEVGQEVLVAFYNNDLKSGVIIAQI
ncbi:hypothetical protein [Clostridium ihumii]|uniref:hypothetical protein n=1 Tax=Clostridium ihumii TaxID=1470356 RepID=UPI000AB5B280|nr:hypothetical protein [Clostridium ihumii]